MKEINKVLYTSCPIRQLQAASLGIVAGAKCLSLPYPIPVGNLPVNCRFRIIFRQGFDTLYATRRFAIRELRRFISSRYVFSPSFHFNLILSLISFSIGDCTESKQSHSLYSQQIIF